MNKSKDTITIVVLLGPPGSGKGTQAKKVANTLKLPHVDTGNLIREAIKNETPLGIKAKDIVESGRLLPDQLVNSLIKEKLYSLKEDSFQGFILDGFPRTIGQAEALEKIIEELNLGPLKIFNVQAPEDLLIKRLSSRRLCSNKDCGEIYNLVSKKPEKENICDKCGSPLYQRKDDLEEACRQRLVEYKNKTAPLEKYYKDKKMLIDIDGSKDKDIVFKEINVIMNSCP